jgi:hypothetical protein
MKNRKARNEFADKYVDKLKDHMQKVKQVKKKAATRTKLYSGEYKDLITEKRAANKIDCAIQSKQYSDELKQFQAINKNLGPS